MTARTAAVAGLILTFHCMLARATLVAIVPARDGLAIAADSRRGFLGAQCDGAFKILRLERPAHTVALVTGDSEFVAPPPTGTADLCGYLARAPRLLDLNSVVEKALAKQGSDVTRISMADLNSACVDAVTKFRAHYPAAMSGYAGREIFSVVVASLTPAGSKSVLRRFVVRVSAEGHVEAADASETVLDLRSASGVWMFGETEWANRVVLAGAGRRFLSGRTVAFLRERKPVGEVAAQDAAVVARDVVEAAERAAESDPPTSGVGGSVRVVVVRP